MGATKNNVSRRKNTSRSKSNIKVVSSGKNSLFSRRNALVVAIIFGGIGVLALVITYAISQAYTLQPNQLESANSCGNQPSLTNTSPQRLKLPPKTKCDIAPMVQAKDAVLNQYLSGKVNSKVKVCVSMYAEKSASTAGIRMTGTSDNIATNVTVPKSTATLLCGKEVTLLSESGNFEISNRGKVNLHILFVRYIVTAAIPVVSEPTPPSLSTTYGPVQRSAPTLPYVTPEEFGAKGNATDDDTTAMQNALNSASGKILWLAADKTYRVSKTIQVPSNTTVMGAGKKSVIKFTWTDVNTTTSGGGTNMRTKGTSSTNIHLANFVLEGASDGLPRGLNADNPEGNVPLLKLIRLSNFSVKNMELRKAAGLSISYSGSTHGTFRHNYVHHSGRDGITGYMDQGQNVTDIVVDANYIEKTGDDAIAINGLVPGQNVAPLAGGGNPLPRNITITNNVIDGWHTDPNGKNLGRGIALNGVAGVLVQGNTISYPNSTGILLTGCNSHICNTSTTDWYSENAQLINNTISNSTGGSRPGAIAIIKTKNSVVTGNKASYSHPYSFGGCETGCSISGNTETSVINR